MRKTHRTTVLISAESTMALRKLAMEFGFLSEHGSTAGEGSVSRLMEAIGQGDIQLVPIENLGMPPKSLRELVRDVVEEVLAERMAA